MSFLIIRKKKRHTHTFIHLYIRKTLRIYHDIVLSSTTGRGKVERIN
jgi:hypothetical protein